MPGATLSTRAALELALGLQRAGRLADAAAIYEGVLAIDAGDFNALHMLGVVRYRQKDFARAEALLRRALERDPANGGAHSNLGNVLRDSGRPEAALAAYARALRELPDTAAGVLSNRGIALMQLERHAEAEADFARARALDPGNVDAHLSEALSRLSRGDYAGGWPLYEWRWRKPGLEAAMPATGAPRWTGREPLRGRRVFLVAEQGIGDTVLALRFVPVLQARGARVLLRVQAPLEPLARASFPDAELVAASGAPPAHDFACPLLSLPGALGVTRVTVPASVPYLRLPPGPRERWASRLARDGRPLVGLAWRGNPAYEDDRRRSMALARLAPLLSRRDVRFVSLLRETHEDERELHATIEPLGAAFRDLDDNAAAIARLDAVVTVDTASAHLAGALGVPAWVMLSNAPYWPWGIRGESSPWYPTARLFRQSTPGDWDGVVSRVARALDELAASVAC